MLHFQTVTPNEINFSWQLMLQLMDLEVSWQQWLQFQTGLSKKDTKNFFSWQLILQLTG
jgi:hypothetical protein